MNGESELLLNLTFLPTRKRTVAIGLDQGPLKVNLSCMMRTTIERRRRNSSSKGLGNDAMS